MIPEEYFTNSIFGVPQRFRHPGCTPLHKDAGLVVTRYPDGWVWYCHRCRKGGRKKLNSLAPSRLLSFLQATSLVDKNSSVIQLPRDYTIEIPPAGLAWLYQYHITEAEILRYDIGYSPASHRVIFPVYHDGKLVFWIGRLVGQQPTAENPKYFSPLPKKDIYFTVDRTGPVVAIVEDIVSAIKVARVCAVVAVIAAYVPDKLVFSLLDNYQTVALWLDYDKTQKMFQVVMRQQMLGHDIFLVPTFKDPKFFPDEEINRLILRGAYVKPMVGVSTC